ncbi:MAG: DUF3109 family protein [Rikenellaceae bacterium]
MIDIDGKIVSFDLFEAQFCCNLAKCKGICCVEGDSGAPLEEQEIEQIKDSWEAFKKYMSTEGVRAVEEQGFGVLDADSDLTTPLINGGECAYITDGEDGMKFCAIEKAWRAGECDFIKPISCHLYPIRVAKFSNGTQGLQYHRWHICRDAVTLGKRKGIAVYKSLKEPIIRAWGEEFYKSLEEADKYIKENPQ